ncbi:ROK family protein [Labedaea rhizosphaerae]|uniref:Glucokinase n=1 Tax=Labedaea rhizosphaerae TaxID=598644 RepID=A0A4R6SAW3_LABRH|nr:ROK family protein [Labedaea rhizosphaerae]TDP96587.1 glucokinase [Labedaea rhizosphaerae]
MPERLVVAVDVGGTDTKAALVDAEGTVRAERRLATPPPGPDRVAEIVEVVAELADALARQAGTRPDALGLVVPGIVDPARGMAVYSANLGWRDAPLRDLVAERTGLTVAFDHDVRAGGLAEARLGAARGTTNSMFLPLGTGIAAAFVLAGRVHAADGYAGEIGHANVGHDEPCSCGLVGCFEAISSAAAVARRYAKRTGRPVRGAAEVAALLPDDPDARAVWADAVHGIAFALAWTASMFAPEVVVIGGGLSLAGAGLLDPVAEELAGMLSFQRAPRLVTAKLGDQAGCLGAGLLALDLPAAPEES